MVEDNTKKLPEAEEKKQEKLLGPGGLQETPPKRTEKKEQKRPRIPVLRTFEHDTKKIIKEKGGVELRTMVAKEMQEKKEAQQEYKKKVKEMHKEALILREKQQKIQRGEETPVKKEREEPIIDEQLTKAAAGAAEHIQNVVKKAQEKRVKRETPQEIPSQEEGIIEERRYSPLKRHDLGAAAVRPAQTTQTEQQTPEETAKQFEEPEKKEGFLARLRGRTKAPGEAFSQKEREMMQRQQQEVVKKKEMEEEWQKFQNKKETLREQGFMLRDVRSYNPFPKKNKTLKRQNLIAIGSVVVVLLGLIFLVVTVLTRPQETPGYIAPETLRPTRDVVTSEQKTAVNVVIDREEWDGITSQQSPPFTVTKFIPFENKEQDRVQVSLGQLLSTFSVAIPTGLFDTLGSYYFIGNYTTQDEIHGLFILSVKNYGDALVRMLNWEKFLINGIVNLFPNRLETTNPENTTVEKRIIDNQDVRILKNQKTETKVSYYFFNRSVLVIIVGDETIIPQINRRIIAANAR